MIFFLALVLGLGSPIVDRVVPVTEQFIQDLPGGSGGSIHLAHENFAALIDQCAEVPISAPGGSASNVLRALAILGTPCAQIGIVGTDDVGDFYVLALKESGVESRLWEVDMPRLKYCLWCRRLDVGPCGFVQVLQR